MNDIQKIIYDAQRSPRYWTDLADMELAAMLNEEMERLDVSPGRLAKAVDISLDRIEAISAGEAPDLTIEEISKILFVFGKRLSLSLAPAKVERVKSLDEMWPIEEGTDEEEDALWASVSLPITEDDWKIALESL